ncbi:hypothetical protein GCM10027535_36520 [Mycolicibacterium hippocampi]|uniref:Uncharacterized protein n=1 Tax=Mycolicibacterium hippocampi TaxID=659824 RepID=A0A7I9ZI93_9MYCO|nr:hypothetical protein MHIP_12280 [Mycolicibacterium hippocampi]
MLLPVTLLLRRAYVAELIWAAVVAKAADGGHRRIAARLGIPGSTVRGWLRVITGRAQVVRHWFLSVAVAAGVDVSIPTSTGSGCGDVVAAVGAARAAIGARFGDRCGDVGAGGCRVQRCPAAVTGLAAGAETGRCNTS